MPISIFQIGGGLIAAHNEDIPTLDKFVHFDDDVAVAGVLSDSEILTKEVDEEDDITNRRT